MEKVTMKQIAEEMGISINAVSLALNDRKGVSAKTKAKVLATADRLGYSYLDNQYRKTLASVNICVLVRSLFIKNSNFYTTILSAAQKEAEEKGYEFLVHFVGQTFGLPPCIVEGRVGGVLVMGQVDDACLQLLAQTRIPTVLVDHSSYLTPFDSILSDGTKGTILTMLHLLRQGYKKIGFFGELAYSESIKERFKGYQQMLSATGLCETLEELMRYTLRYSILEDIEQAVILRDQEILERKLKEMAEIPEAFVCSNDEAARQLIFTLERLGFQVPRDIAVAGFDDGSLATLFIPSLTSVRVPQEEMGKNAVRRLEWRMEHPKEPTERVLMDVKFIVRQSTVRDS